MPSRNRVPILTGIVIGAVFIITLSVILLSPSGLWIPNETIQKDKVVVFSGIINGTTHQIYTVNSDGTHLTKLTEEEDNLWHFEPVSSPDGSKIAYVTHSSFVNMPPDGKRVESLYVINADGTRKWLLVNSSNIGVGRHVWSPDGTKIAFEGSDDIFVVNVDDTNLVRVTKDGEHSTDVIPVWSSNSKIMFTSVLRNGTEVFGASLKEVNIDGTGSRTLLDYEYNVDVGHIWSPDLSKISFIHMNGEISASLYVMNADGSDQTKLADSPPSFANREWSPDSTKVAFQHWTGDYQDIYITDIDDGSYRNLSNSNTFDGSPTWSSDGKKIAFTRIISEEEAGIYVMNSDGSGQKQVAKMKPSIVNTPLDWLS